MSTKVNLKINFKTLGIISVIILVLALGISTTYSLFYNEKTLPKNNDYMTGLLSVEAKSKSDTISLSGTLPMSDEEGAETEPYVFTIKNSGNLDYKFNIKLLSTSANTISPQYIKLKIDNNNPITLSSLTSSIIKQNITLRAKESIDISIRIWLASNTPNTEIGKTFNSKILTEGQAIYTNSNNEALQGAALTINNLYTEAQKQTVTNNNITYNTAPSVSLMNDRLGNKNTPLDDGNIRYYGASPNNYVYFNCTDYNNQSSSTCETWRIIGVFNGKLKLIRNEPIGNYSWDTSDSSINAGVGVNEWSQADIMKLLNPGYENETIGGSLYYNGGSGTCYYWENNGTTSCNFTNTGLRNDKTRNMIDESTWYTGAWVYAAIYANNVYNNERGTTTVSNPGDGVTRTTRWNGKVALPYASDYGYATDFNYCTSNLNGYSNSGCLDNNWMKLSENYFWLINSYSNSPTLAWYIHGSGVLYFNTDVRWCGWIIPTLYLSPEISFKSGAGTSSNPYQLKA